MMGRRWEVKTGGAECDSGWAEGAKGAHPEARRVCFVHVKARLDAQFVAQNSMSRRAKLVLCTRGCLRHRAPTRSLPACASTSPPAYPPARCPAHSLTRLPVRAPTIVRASFSVAACVSGCTRKRAGPRAHSH
eukprot:4097955-Pleurochrysis_carterae.AAC.1